MSGGALGFLAEEAGDNPALSVSEGEGGECVSV